MSGVRSSPRSLIAAASFAAVSQVDLTQGFPSTPRLLELLVNVSSNTTLGLRMSNNGGASFYSSASSYVDSGASTFSGSWTVNADTVGNILRCNPSANVRFFQIELMTHYAPGIRIFGKGNGSVLLNSGQHQDAVSFNALRLIFGASVDGNYALFDRGPTQ